MRTSGKGRAPPLGKRLIWVPDRLDLMTKGRGRGGRDRIGIFWGRAALQVLCCPFLIAIDEGWDDQRDASVCEVPHHRNEE